MKKYVLHAGWIRSKNDDQEHWISCEQLRQLYKLNPEECIYIPRYGEEAWILKGVDATTLMHLYPSYSGNYELPT